MKVSVIGAGYVGLCGGAVLSDLGNTVWVLRRNKKKIDDLKKGIMPIYEPGLSTLVKRNLKKGTLIPTTNYSECVPFSDVVFIAVGTPQDEITGAADLTQVFAAATEVAKNLKEGYTVVVDKSTVPPGTAEKVTAIINKHKKNKKVLFDVVSSPEFLREGKAVEDSVKPDRVVIGTEVSRARSLMVKLHTPLKCPLVLTSVRSAEVIKYSANAYLSLRIGFIDQIANLCEKMGADVSDVIKGIGLDRRIGTHYWFPGMGYGGYCFPKDVKALASLFVEAGETDNLFTKLDQLNEERLGRYLLKIKKAVGGLSGKTIGVLGFAAKPGTDDIRGSIAIKLIKKLVKSGAKVAGFDPLAQENTKNEIGGIVKYFSDPLDVVRNTDALIVTIEADDFRRLNMVKIKELMRKPIIFDVKNSFNKEKLRKEGFLLYQTGR